MRKEFYHDLQEESQMRHIGLAKGMAWGLVGGLVGTIVMDIVCVGALLVMGLPAVVSFSTIGDTAAGFFSMLGLNMANGVPLGTAMHYLIGPVLGIIFSAAVSQTDAFRVNTIKKGLVFGILYTQVISQPILAAAPIILKMTASETLQWFGVSFVMHLIWGAVLGVIVSCGLGLVSAAKHS